MNQGGDTGHDDYGLPRVDIQIPDDARELDRDVQAYHRELRALRRHERSMRWRAPLRRSGMIVPLIAGCLVLAMVAGMVLTMFSANPLLHRDRRRAAAGLRSHRRVKPPAIACTPRRAPVGQPGTRPAVHGHRRAGIVILPLARCCSAAWAATAERSVALEIGSFTPTVFSFDEAGQVTEQARILRDRDLRLVRPGVAGCEASASGAAAASSPCHRAERQRLRFELRLSHGLRHRDEHHPRGAAGQLLELDALSRQHAEGPGFPLGHGEPGPSGARCGAVYRLELVAQAAHRDQVRGAPGSGSILARSRLTWTSSVLVSPT